MSLVSRSGPAALALAIAGGTYFGLYRPLQIEWGATAAEVGRAMPGDEIVAQPIFCTTRALTIAAPPERVWPWIAQIGRADVGWYSYDFVDHGSRESAREILPTSQHSIGARLSATGDKAKGFYVRGLSAPRWLLVATGNDSMTWAWELLPQDENHTRLVSRIRMRGGTTPLAVAAMDAGDFVMMRQMLLGVRDRVEGRPLRSFADLTTEFLLWGVCFLGFLLAEVGLIFGRGWRVRAFLATAASVLTILLVIAQPSVWVDAVGAAVILASFVATLWLVRSDTGRASARHSDATA